MLFTIGHGTRPLPTFLHLLEQYSIEFLIDIRSVPYSAFNPQYRQPEFVTALRAAGFRYIYMGNSLGGRPTHPTCYNANGRLDYELVRTQPFFLEGIERIVTAYEKGINVALMCSESKPENCHRSKLVGRSLQERNIPIHHIDEEGNLRSQSELTQTPTLLLF
ncbi:MAG: DUF488 domain-containing protein [Bacteroidetes bacterium]|nr:DUF488 domain-containing protein [Bacteroidota bacterium]